MVAGDEVVVDHDGYRPSHHLLLIYSLVSFDFYLSLFFDPNKGEEEKLMELRGRFPSSLGSRPST